MTDKLRLDYINSLPQPFIAKFPSEQWEVYDIDVETGLVRVLVCGLLEIRHIGEVISFIDADNQPHYPDDFYIHNELRNSAKE